MLSITSGKSSSSQFVLPPASEASRKIFPRPVNSQYRSMLGKRWIIFDNLSDPQSACHVGNIPPFQSALAFKFPDG